MSDGLLDGYCDLAIIVYIPGSIIKAVAAGHQAREHVVAFTAFADDNRVFYFQRWKPHDLDGCATIISVPSIPNRIKTILMTRFAYEG